MASRTPQKLSNIHAELRQRILSGDWKVGEKLPKEGELAAKFECSLGTVSKAMALLAHEGLVERRPRAGTRVLGNTPNAAGRAVRSAELDAYAFIYPSEQHEGIWRTVKGFQHAAHDAQRRVLMLTSGLDYSKEAEFIGRLGEFDVRGAVVYPNLPTTQDQRHFEQLVADSKLPLVLAEVGVPGVTCPSVVVDGFHAGHTMAKYLIDSGLKKIGFFSNYARLSSMRDRYLGYRWALQEAGLAEPVGGVMLETDMNPDFSDPFADPERLANKFIAAAGQLDGVVCVDDFLAVGFLRAAKSHGLKVDNKNLRVVGIGDYAFAAKADVPLTTYRIPYEELGRNCFRLLDDLVNGIKHPVSECLVRGELVLRDS
ncbi:MAG: LacI family DNA-binding transcriptional regulator [Rariglobus sp.]|nr:GntR family transcriptional regulator [Rariglobus sp.]